LEPTLEELTAHFGALGENLSVLLDGIDMQKDEARNAQNATWLWLQASQIAIIVLGALASAVVAAGNRISSIAPWVIVPTTLITILTGISSFYDFRGEYVRQFQLAASLARLQTNVIVDLNNALALRDNASINGMDPEDYIGSKYGEFDALLSGYIEKRRELFGVGQN
jgi:hypothetical protein